MSPRASSILASKSRLLRFLVPPRPSRRGGNVRPGGDSHFENNMKRAAKENDLPMDGGEQSPPAMAKPEPASLPQISTGNIVFAFNLGGFSCLLAVLANLFDVTKGSELPH